MSGGGQPLPGDGRFTGTGQPIPGDPRPLSSRARTAAAAGQVDRRRVAQPSGWWGMVLLLCAEVTLFGTIIGSYFYLDFRAPRWPPAGIRAPDILIPLVSTGVLVALTPLFTLSVRAARSGDRWRAVALVVAALVVQCAYLGLQIRLLVDDFHMFDPRASAYGSAYYVTLITHHAHVLFGILLDGVVIWKLVMKGLDNYWLIGLRGLALYWYVINALAVVVVFTVLSPSL